MGLSDSVCSSYKTLVIHNSFMGKEKEDHCDNWCAERETWAESNFLCIYACAIDQSAGNDCFNKDCSKLDVAVECLCLAVLVHEDDCKAPEYVKSKKEHWNAEVRVGEDSCVSVENANAVYC